jgi:PAS domain-containing protein
MILATIPTGIALVALHQHGLAGTLSLAGLLGIFLWSGLASAVAQRLWSTDPSASQLHALLAIQVLGVTAVIYAIGWGPTLAIGYAFVFAGDLEEIGARVYRPALGWFGAGMALGQVAIAAGWAYSYVPTPEVHALAFLSALGTGFVVQLLGRKTAQQELTEASLRAGEDHFRKLFTQNPQPMWLYAEDTGRFLDVNNAALDTYGYTREGFLSLHLADIVRGSQHLLKSQELIDVEVDANRLSMTDRSVVLMTVRDMTERNRLEAALRHRAFHDSLTGLANRACSSIASSTRFIGCVALVRPRRCS